MKLTTVEAVLHDEGKAYDMDDYSITIRISCDGAGMVIIERHGDEIALNMSELRHVYDSASFLVSKAKEGSKE